MAVAMAGDATAFAAASGAIAGGEGLPAGLPAADGAALLASAGGTISVGGGTWATLVAADGAALLASASGTISVGEGTSATLAAEGEGGVAGCGLAADEGVSATAGDDWATAAALAFCPAANFWRCTIGRIAPWRAATAPDAAAVVLYVAPWSSASPGSTGGSAPEAAEVNAATGRRARPLIIGVSSTPASCSANGTTDAAAAGSPGTAPGAEDILEAATAGIGDP